MIPADLTSSLHVPLVTCIMPTRNRRRFVPLALAYFARQDYEPRELIVLDDGDDPVAELMPDDPRVRYVRLDRRQTVGAKRNMGCRLAKGDVIVHWDDDDWMADWRLTYQVAQLREKDADL
ncbi:MAG: glycosyltransferase family 2 protein, partial [Anaerolineae bacterium]|nr:glycosyltransferase family 2 protein [Anaerolineae bacterium]